MDQVLQTETLTERQLHHWHLLQTFREALAQVFGQAQLNPSFADPRRSLEAADYLSLFLFGLFNPAIRTMRGLCQASRLARVQAEVCQRAVSLGSFSEAQHLLEPGLLESVLSHLGQQLPPLPAHAKLGPWKWLIQDGSLFRALPRMTWALYGGGKAGAPNRAVKLHPSLHLLQDKPQVAVVRPGQQCKRKVWQERWKAAQAYVGDRCFGQDYRLFAKLQVKGCAFVLRLREQQAVIHVLEELALSAEDRQAGGTRQAWACLGCKSRYQSMRVRVVWLQTQDNSPLILVSNLSPEQLPAAMLSLLCRARWKIEVFFRWIKCILGCRHWLAESASGVAIQIYLALIASLLLQLYTGRKPNKRMMELLQLHQMGIATDQELAEGLQRERQRLLSKSKV